MSRIGFVQKFTEKQFKYFEARCRPDHDHKKNGKLMTYGNDLYSDSGFIDDTESLSEISKANDEYVIKTLGKNGHDIIGNTLISLICNNQKFKTTYPELCRDIDASKYKIKHNTWLGTQYCPFVDEETWQCGNSTIPQFGGTDFEITKLETEDVLKITLLHIHLIHHHHFYEGNVEYRVSPQRLIEFFDLIPTNQEENKC